MAVHSARGYSVGVGKRHISVAWKSSDYFSTLNTASKLESMTTRQWDVSYTSDEREIEREFIFHIAKTLNKYTTEMQN